MKWKELAACQGEDTEAFYDIYENNPDVRPAVDKVCMNCPVQKDCFAAGVSGKDYGVWAGYIFLMERLMPPSITIEPTLSGPNYGRT